MFLASVFYFFPELMARRFEKKQKNGSIFFIAFFVGWPDVMSVTTLTHGLG